MWACGHEGQECLCPLVGEMPTGPSPETIPTGIYPDGLRQRSHQSTMDTWPQAMEASVRPRVPALWLDSASASQVATHPRETGSSSWA